MNFSGKRMLGLTFAAVVTAAAAVGGASRQAYAERIEALCEASSYQGPDAPDSIPPGSAGDEIRAVMSAARNGCHHNHFNWK